MLGIHAVANVTTMKNIKGIRDVPMIYDPRQPVGKPLIFCNSDAPVATTVDISNKQPTLLRRLFFNLFPKSLDGGFAAITSAKNFLLGERHHDEFVTNKWGYVKPPFGMEKLAL